MEAGTEEGEGEAEEGDAGLDTTCTRTGTLAPPATTTADEALLVMTTPPLGSPPTPSGPVLTTTWVVVGPTLCTDTPMPLGAPAAGPVLRTAGPCPAACAGPARAEWGPPTAWGRACPGPRSGPTWLLTTTTTGEDDEEEEEAAEGDPDADEGFLDSDTTGMGIGLGAAAAPPAAAGLVAG